MGRHRKQGKNQTPAMKPAPTVFVLYIPGGGMLGLIPLVMSSYLEQLVGKPAAHMFQVKVGASVGAIDVATISLPHPDNAATPCFTGQDCIENFIDYGQRFFPPIANRQLKMIASNFSWVVRDHIDPLQRELLQLKSIHANCDDMLKSASPEAAALIERIRHHAARRWLTLGDRRSILKLCDVLKDMAPHLQDNAKKIGELAYARSATRAIGILFGRAALSLSAIFGDLARANMFDPDIPRQTFIETFGEMPLSACIGSVFMTAFDKQDHRAITSFCLRDDLFSLDPAAPSRTGGIVKIWDALMASISNPFAYRPHRTEDGAICSDKAIVHSPVFCINEVLKHKPASSRVRLVVLHTGSYLTLDHRERDLIEYNTRHGLIGNFLSGMESDELSSYVMSGVRDMLPADNITEIVPRLAAHSYEESLSVPSKDIMDASDENIRRLQLTAQRTMAENRNAIHSLAKDIADNMLLLGQMTKAEHEAAMDRLGLPASAELWMQMADTIAPEPKPLTSRLRDMWDRARIVPAKAGGRMALNDDTPATLPWYMRQPY